MAIRGVSSPAVDTGRHQRCDHHQCSEHESHQNPFRCLRDATFRRNEFWRLVAAREIIFRQKLFLVEAQETSDGAYKAAIEDAARELVPILILQSFQETQTNTGSYNYLVGRNFAPLALVFQTFPKISLGHEIEPCRRRRTLAESVAPLDGTIGGAANRVKQPRFRCECSQRTKTILPPALFILRLLRCGRSGHPSSRT